MRLTVVGCWSPYPAPGEACSGYLLEQDGFTLLVDCGSGVLSRLATFADLARVDAVWLSHLHGDHMADILSLRYAVDADLGSGRRQAPLLVYGPGAPAAEWGILPYREAVTTVAVAAGDSLTVGPLTVSTVATVHPLPTLAGRFTAGGRSLLFTGDTAETDAVADLGAGADVWLAEATLPEAYRHHTRFGHMTAGQCGRLARRAAAARLVITHFWPGTDRAAQAAEAAAGFEAEVTVAAERLSLDV